MGGPEPGLDWPCVLSCPPHSCPAAPTRLVTGLFCLAPPPHSHPTPTPAPQRGGRGGPLSVCGAQRAAPALAPARLLGALRGGWSWVAAAARGGWCVDGKAVARGWFSGCQYVGPGAAHAEPLCTPAQDRMHATHPHPAPLLLPPAGADGRPRGAAGGGGGAGGALFFRRRAGRGGAAAHHRAGGRNGPAGQQDAGMQWWLAAWKGGKGARLASHSFLGWPASPAHILSSHFPPTLTHSPPHPPSPPPPCRACCTICLTGRGGSARA